jgi:4-amino-4-deoxy-L-arabinose transferase-like glycosyltransferase
MDSHSQEATPKLTIEKSDSSTGIRTFLMMVLLGLVVRFVVALFSYRYLLDTSEDYFSFGWEAGRVAKSITLGHGFSSPYQGDSGPTAALPPLYPIFLAGIFKLFGIYTKTSALVILGIQSVISALTCIPIYRIARRTFGDRAARVAGWTWAVFPYAVFISAATIWSTSLSALLLALLFLLALQLADGAGWSDWLGLGLLSGVIGLTNPTLLPVVAALVIWVWFRLRQRGARCVLQATVAALIAVLCISPWVVRNYQTFGRFIPMRSNLGLHLYVGNSLDTSEYWHVEKDPPHSPVEMEEMKQLGEIKYMARKKQMAYDFIASHPATYLYLVFKRISYFWTGAWNLTPEFLKANPGEAANIPVCTAVSVLAFLGLRRLYRRDGVMAWAYIMCFVIYPLLYYATTYEIPYRHPLDPLFVVLGVAGVVRNPGKVMHSYDSGKTNRGGVAGV